MMEQCQKPSLPHVPRTYNVLVKFYSWVVLTGIKDIIKIIYRSTLLYNLYKENAIFDLNMENFAKLKKYEYKIFLGKNYVDSTT